MMVCESYLINSEEYQILWMKSWKTPKIWPLSVVSRHSMWWGDTYLWNFTQNSYGWFGAFEISRHVSQALLSNPPVWYCFNCLHSDCVKLFRFHPSNKRSVSKVHNCSMHHFHKFANLFCPFFQSLCTKTRQPVEMHWHKEPLYLPVDCYGCLYDGSLVLSSDSHLQTSQMCGLLMMPGERLNMLKRTAAPRLRADIILPPFLMPNYIPYSTFVSISH